MHTMNINVAHADSVIVVIISSFELNLSKNASSFLKNSFLKRIRSGRARINASPGVRTKYQRCEFNLSIVIPVIHITGKLTIYDRKQLRIYKNGNKKIVKELEENFTRTIDDVTKRRSRINGIFEYTMINANTEKTINKIIY